MILLACCMVEFLYTGLTKSLAVLLPSLTEQFHTGTWLIGGAINLMGSVKDFSCKLTMKYFKYKSTSNHLMSKVKSAED